MPGSSSLTALLSANAHTIYGPTRHLDVITFAPSSSRKTCAAIVEHNPAGRSYIHCTSAKEVSRVAAVDHLLVITEDILQHMMDAQGIESCGWLPLSAPGAAAANSIAAATSVVGSVAGSVAGSLPGSRRGSVQPQMMMMGLGAQMQLATGGMAPSSRPSGSPNETYTIPPGMALVRRSSDHAYQQNQPGAIVQRTNSDIIHQPKPVPVGRAGASRGAVRWDMGSES